MRNDDIDFAWNAVAPILGKFKYYDIKNIVGLAGFDAKILDGLGYDGWRQQNTGTDQLVSEIGSRFLRFDPEKNSIFEHCYRRNFK